MFACCCVSKIVYFWWGWTQLDITDGWGSWSINFFNNKFVFQVYTFTSWCVHWVDKWFLCNKIINVYFSVWNPHPNLKRMWWMILLIYWRPERPSHQNQNQNHAQNQDQNQRTNLSQDHVPLARGQGVEVVHHLHRVDSDPDLDPGEQKTNQQNSDILY